MRQPRFISPEEAVSYVKNGDAVNFGSIATVPGVLVDALIKRGRAGELHGVTIRHLLTVGNAEYAGPEFEGVFQTESFFVGDNIRKHVNNGDADYIPISLSQIPMLYYGGHLTCDVAMIQVSEPDENGMVSMGPSVDISFAAVECAKIVIAVVNSHMPHTYGDGLLPQSRITYWVKHDCPLATAEPTPPNAIERSIGQYCASLVEDGNCLQLGIGAIPNAVLSGLRHRRHLGIHSEMLSDGILDLVNCGAIDGSCKKIDQGKLISSFLYGSQKLYDFSHRNTMLEMRNTGYTNDPMIIAQNDNVIAINSALQIDLTGQVCADSLGKMIYSGVGGQLDFIYGAARSKGGKAIIAMSSCTAKGVSKITDVITPGGGVVTPRSLIHFMVTEYGAVELFGCSLKERVRRIISIAHPDHREELEREAFKRFGPRFLRRS